MGPSSITKPTSSSYSLPLMLFVLTISTLLPIAQPHVFNVRDYGAIPDGKSDCSKAFQSAWKAACAAEDGNVKISIPEGRYATFPITFRGPCKRPIVFQLNGIVEAPHDLRHFPTTDWVVFRYLSNLSVVGKGSFHGNGKDSWSQNHCRSNAHHCSLPTNVKFAFVKDSSMEGISSVDSKMFHFLVFKCVNFEIRNVRITAPQNSPNTDGIHISESTNVHVTGSQIGTGDDCISIGPGNSGVFISKVHCGPGHGISIGSLGKGKRENDVTKVRVSDCTFKETMNGVRIKSWKDSHVLEASDFYFHDLTMIDVYNPIIIDQEYCPGGGCDHQPPSRVKIRNVKFNKITGTSASEVAVNIKCSERVPCKDIVIGDISLTYRGNRRNTDAKALCSHAHGSSYGTMVPPSCL